MMRHQQLGLILQEELCKTILQRELGPKFQFGGNFIQEVLWDLVNHPYT